MEKASTTLWWRHSRPSFYDPEYGSAVQRAEESYKRHSSAPRLALWDSRCRGSLVLCPQRVDG
jgi:hypothetical protein